VANCPRWLVLWLMSAVARAVACPWYIAGTPWWSLYGPGIACPYGSFGDHFGLSLSAAVGALIKCSVYRESPLGGLVAIAEFLNVVKKDQMDLSHMESASVWLSGRRVSNDVTSTRSRRRSP
jgi:hypothetical protein